MNELDFRNRTAVITGGDVVLRGCVPEHLDALVVKLREAGARLEPGGGGGVASTGPSPTRT